MPWNLGIFVENIESYLAACRHYLARVVSVETADIHDRNKYRNLLGFYVDECTKWLADPSVETADEYKAVRTLMDRCERNVGAAAIWLRSQVR